MAFSKGEVNRAGAVIAENRRPRTAEEIDRLGAAVDVVDWWRSEHAAPLNAVAANLRYYVAEVGEPAVSQRLKRLPTVANKLVREPTMKLTQMADIGGVRAMVPDQRAAFTVALRLQKNWTIIRFRDYVSEPKADGYRALHLINRHRGRLIEIQIRTPLQDNWANSVERMTRSKAPGLKFGSGPDRLREMYRGLSGLYAELESAPDTIHAIAKNEEIGRWVDKFPDVVYDP